MAEKAQDPSTSESAKPSRDKEKEEGSFARTTLPYVIAALLASAAMAWYFFVFVPTKLDYFVGLRFRTLAVASGQIASKIDNLARALGSVPKPLAPERDSVCPELTIEERDYVALVLPEIHLPAAASAQGPQFIVCDVAASVNWTDVATQAAAASRRDFDDLIIADARGDVVWQREITTPRIGNLSELLAAPSERAGWLSLSWREQATMPAKKDPANLRSSAVLKAVNLGGTSTLLLVQAVLLTEKNITLSASDITKAGEGTRLYVAGVVSRAGLLQQARRIPGAWVVLIALPIVVLFLAIPFVKLATLTMKERYRFSDVVLMIFATIAASGLGAMIPFVSAPASAPDATLEELSNVINGGLKAETTQALRLAHTILTKRDAIEPRLQECKALGSGLPIEGDPSGKRACELWPALDHVMGPEENVGPSIDLDVVIWFDQAGRQIRKWTTKRQVTGQASHRPFEHYRAVTTNRLWALAQMTEQPADEALTRPFMIDPLRAPTTSELGVVLVTPVPVVEKKAPAYLALNIRPQSVVDPLVPPGYGFAIIAESGKVLFHSEEGLSLQENFFEEVGDAEAVRDKARSYRVARWSGDYHGRPHRFRLQPIEAFRDCPWLIVTFQEVAPVLSREILQQTGTIRLGALSLLIFTGLALVFAALVRPRHQRARDFVQTMLAGIPANVGWVWLLPVLFVLELGEIAKTYAPYAAGRLDQIYATLILIAVISLVVMSLARTTPDLGSRVPEMRRRFLARVELGLLVLLMGALPAIGFARVVTVARETSDMERWLGVVQQQWTARQGRVVERLNGPNYSDELRLRLQNDFGAGPFAADGRYNYLEVQGGFKVEEREEPRNLSPAGQGIVRWLLDLNVFSSSDEPLKAGMQRAIASHVLQVSPQENSDERPEGISWAALMIGGFIFGSSLAGVYFVRRKLWSYGSTAAPSLEETIRKADEAIRNDPDRKMGHIVVLLIGPARAAKDSEARCAVKQVTNFEPIYRVRLLDDKTTVNEEYLDKEVVRVTKTIERHVDAGTLPKPFWIHVSNLETQLVDEDSRTGILKVLDRLLNAVQVSGAASFSRVPSTRSSTSRKSSWKSARASTPIRSPRSPSIVRC